MNEGGCNTNVNSEQDQADQHQLIRDLFENGSERLAGYGLWASTDYLLDVFLQRAQSPQWPFVVNQSLFGLWDLAGDTKTSGLMWSDIDVRNHSFEDSGARNRPEHWIDAWPWNGSPTNWSVTRESFSAFDGNRHLRLYSGLGEPQSMIFCQSSLIQATPNTPYAISAAMRYALSSGHAQIAVLEYDENDLLTQWTHKDFTGGNWTWLTKRHDFRTHEDTVKLNVRFGIGGQEDTHLDVDLVQTRIAHFLQNRSFEHDLDGNGSPDNYETAWVWNGNRTNWNVRRKEFPKKVVNGTHCMRITTGSGGDADARVMSQSDSFEALPSEDYRIAAYMRHQFTSGQSVKWWALEFDENHQYLGSAANNEITGGNWTWNEEELTFTTGAQTRYLAVRFSVGGTTANCKLDVDWIRDYTE